MVPVGGGVFGLAILFAGGFLFEAGFFFAGFAAFFTAFFFIAFFAAFFLAILVSPSWVVTLRVFDYQRMLNRWQYQSSSRIRRA